MPKPRGKNWENRQDKEFQDYILKYLSLDEETGLLKSKIYCSVYVTIKRRNKAIAVPLGHLVWFLRHKRWPTDGLVLDHIDENPLNNRPDNLQEITKEENAFKKRGKGNIEYGTSKYGYGIYVDYSKRDKLYYVRRYLSSKEELDLKKRKLYIGSFKTLEDAEKKIAEVIESLKFNTDDFFNLDADST